MSEITAKNGKVIMTGDEFDDELPPSEARNYAQRIRAAADEAEAQLATIAQACADGHQWGEGTNGWRKDPKTTNYWCTREGCEGHKEEPGWLPFPPKQHHVAFSTTSRDCTGPGCHYCAEEADAAHMRAITRGIFRDASKALDLTIFAKE